ncbi:MAG: ATP-binding cassette domain-containing protein [Nocardioidaceae bacterium]
MSDRPNQHPPELAMTDLVIETTRLRKEYGRPGRRRVAAVDGLDLAVTRGSIHGLLGPNGAGKTTTLRLLLGLARPTSGQMRLFGEPVPGALPGLAPRIGAIVETPTFTRAFTGRRNLQLLAATKRLPKTEVDRVIELLGLRDHQRERYRGYSRGLRQRMGWAAALLGSPDLLILDEPMHGLDAAGVREAHELLRGLGKAGVTVLLASHVLADVQQVCDTVSILGKGRLLGGGPVEEFLGAPEGESVRLVVADPEAALAVLTAAGHPTSQEGEALVVEGVTDPAQLSELLASHGHFVRSLASAGPDLTQVFLHLTDQGLADQGLADRGEEK